MAELLDILRDELDEETIHELSQRVGTDEQSTQRAVSMLLPVLIAGLARNVEQPAGRASLNKALQKDHDGSLLDQLGGLLRGEGSLGGMLGGLFGGESARPASTLPDEALRRQVDGAGIARHVLGDQEDAVIESVANASGMSTNSASRLLALLAPIVMAALGRIKRQENLQEDGIADLIRREGRTIEQAAPEATGQGGLMGWLDSNKDGKVTFADNAAKVGMALGSALLIGVGRRRRRS